MVEYVHQVNYYETDKMGITHHSNYVRFMEEARIHYLNEVGLPYEELEKTGLISPVTSISVDYKSPTTYPDKINIYVKINFYNGIKFGFSYEMRNEKDELIALGKSEHCFLSNSKLVIIKKQFKEIDELLNSLKE